MKALTADVSIVFNGEIYNHADLRDQLEREGVGRWQTGHSDTEVILNGFLHWGIDVIARLRGMFAFGVWDGRRRELWLVRDRMGVKPLYYSVNAGHLLFASEIKALLADPGHPRAVDKTALFHYLSFLATPPPRTMFEGVSKVAAAHWVRISARGDVETRSYWDPLDHATPIRDRTDSEVAEMLLGRLDEAVQLRKVSDVPVGVFLSGGIDSSTNAALFAKGTTEPVRTYSIGYEGENKSYANEFHYARLVAKQISAEHHELLLSEDLLLDFLPLMIALQDEPIADPVCFPVYYLAKLARDSGTVVCQIGEGADELFCGYSSWSNALAWQQNLNAVPGMLPKATVAKLLSGVAHLGDRFRVEYLRRAGRGEPIFWGGAEAFTDAHKRRVLTADTMAMVDAETSWDALSSLRSRYETKSWEKSDLNWMTYLDLNLRLPELLLMRVDKMAMGVSLEGREPFLDHKLVEFAFSIPTAMRYRKGELKRLVKLAVRGLIPDEIIDRPKQGFGVPLQDWIYRRLGGASKNVLGQFCDASGLIDKRESFRLLETGQASQVWFLLNLALWWFHYIDRRDVGQLLRA
jgi:asparagine synthase (glutamine-hydrolysing)